MLHLKRKLCVYKHKHRRIKITKIRTNFLFFDRLSSIVLRHYIVRKKQNEKNSLWFLEDKTSPFFRTCHTFSINYKNLIKISIKIFSRNFTNKYNFGTIFWITLTKVILVCLITSSGGFVYHFELFLKYILIGQSYIVIFWPLKSMEGVG